MSGMCPEWAHGRRLPQDKQTRTEAASPGFGRAGFKIYYLAHYGSVGYFLDRVTFRREVWTLAALTDQSRPPSL